MKASVKEKSGDNCVVNLIFGCIGCCLECFTRFIEFINKNAYVIIAFKDSSFCTAAKDSFSLAVRNAGMFASLNALGDIYTFLGRIIIGGTTGLCGYLIMIGGTYDCKNEYMGIMMFTFIGFLIGAGFLSLFGHVSGAIVVVYIMDSEIQKKSWR